MPDGNYHFHYCGVYAGTETVDWHTHPVWELVRQSFGRCRHHFGTHKIECGEGDIIAIPPDTPHRQESLDGAAGTEYIVFDAPENLRFAACTAAPEPPVAVWVKQILSLWSSAHPARDAMIDGVLRALAAALEPRPRDRNEAPEQLRRARQELERRYTEPLSLAEIAADCGMGRSRFSTEFHHCFGETPMAYLNRKRLELAQRLLRNPRSDIAAVAESCGFADANYFARKFRAACGCAPREYRGRRNGTAE